MKRIALAALLCMTMCTSIAVASPARGVSKDTVTLGAIVDLSGAVAAYGKQVRQGMTMRLNEVNAQGGVHGRRLRLMTEDSGYDPKKAVLAAQKLADVDNVFAVVGHMGTATNMAAMPVLVDKGVINFFPLAAASQMAEPVHPLKYAFLAPYFDQIRTVMPRLVAHNNVKRPCVLFQDDDFGSEVMRSAEAGARSMGMDLVARTTYKRGATDFSSQVARLKAAECDLVVLGTVIRETIGTINESNRIGFKPAFLGSFALYSDLIHKLGGKSMDGLYAAHNVQQPYADEGAEPIRSWARSYTALFNEESTVYSIYGYSILDAWIKAAVRAGPDLNAGSFAKAMEGMTYPPDAFGSPELRFSTSSHLGTRQSRLSQIRDGRWKVISGYLSAPR